MKKCAKCCIELEFNSSNFPKKSTGKDGFDAQCKSCKKERDQKRYQEKREEILNQKKVYYAKKRNGTSVINNAMKNNQQTARQLSEK